MNALTKEGWTITDSPLSLKYEGKDLFIDLGAEKIINAERGSAKIAVAIKTFAGRSDMKDLHLAVGQYVVYEQVLRRLEPERTLYLAVSRPIYEGIFKVAVGALILEERITRLLVFDTDAEVVIQWIS